MESTLAEASANFPFHGHCGFHWIPYGIEAYSSWIPWTSPHGFHETRHYFWGNTIVKNNVTIWNLTLDSASKSCEHIEHNITVTPWDCISNKLTSINIVVVWPHPN
jgi:hypothetical protein